jgi:hypothetical protein
MTWPCSQAMQRRPYEGERLKVEETEARSAAYAVALRAAAGDDEEAASATSRGRARSIVARDESHLW